MLKAPPDDENRDISTWKSLELVEALLRLSDLGHFKHVREIFKFPHQHCPDLLVLSLLQIVSTSFVNQFITDHKYKKLL